MKAIFITALVFGVAQAQAASYELNASAQESINCKKAVVALGTLIIGRTNLFTVKSKKFTAGECDGETCSLDRENFEIQYKDQSVGRKISVSAAGPDTANRCELSWQ